MFQSKLSSLAVIYNDDLIANFDQQKARCYLVCCLVLTAAKECASGPTFL